MAIVMGNRFTQSRTCAKQNDSLPRRLPIRQSKEKHIALTANWTKQGALMTSHKGKKLFSRKSGKLES